MTFDPTQTHPDYNGFAPSWRLMRTAFDGEDAIRAAGEAYLPRKASIRGICDESGNEDRARQAAAYEDYKARAEFPELVEPAVTASVGVICATPPAIELPPGLEAIRERATADGLTLDGLFTRIVGELLTVGRFGLLPGLRGSGAPVLAGYPTESIRNWDAPGGVLSWLMLDESGPVRDPATGKWSDAEAFRECGLDDVGRFFARVWRKPSGGIWVAEDEPPALTPRKANLTETPFVFIGSRDLTPTPDSVPLYGLAKLAVRAYTLDADYRFGLHMTSEPTPVVIGVSEHDDGPTAIGASVIWRVPPGGDAKFLEFTGAGLSAQHRERADTLERARAFTVQTIASGGRESGEALKTRLAAQTASLRTIAQNAAAGLEKALKHLAVWMGENPDAVKVTPNLEFFAAELTAPEISAIVSAWTSGAISWATCFAKLQKGGVIAQGRTEDEEREAMDADPEPKDADESEAFAALGEPPEALRDGA